MYRFEGRAGEDLRIWEARTEAMLKEKDVLYVVLNDVNGVQKTKITNGKKLKTAKALGTILSVVGTKPFKLVLIFETDLVEV